MNVFPANFMIEELTYIPTGTYTPMFIRPYTVNTTEAAIETLSNTINDNAAGKVTSAELSSVMTEIIQPSAVGLPTSIDKNWIDERKFIFLLKISNVGPLGDVNKYYLQGFTDHAGITDTGAIDLNLLHTVNTVVETVSMTITTPVGVQIKESLKAIYNILSNGIYEEVYTQRPLDIVRNMELTGAVSQLSTRDDINTLYIGSQLSNFDTRLNLSDVNNNISSQYLSKILNSGMHTHAENAIEIGDSSISTAGDQSYIVERSISDNRFLHYISRLEGFTATTNTFKFSSLMKLDSTIYDRFVVLKITKDILTPEGQNTPDVGEYWNGQDPVTLKAYSLIEASVSVATKLGFNKLFFTASNISNPTGAAEVFINNFNSIINLGERDYNVLLEIFKSKFLTDVFIPETEGGAAPTHMEVYVDLVGTTKIKLKYYDMPETWYTIPTFANSLFAPVITVDKNTLDYSVDAFNSMVSSLHANMISDPEIITHPGGYV
jgi:hypothetical protein